MNREKKLVPKLRFPGFEGEWVEKRLGEVIEISSASRVHKHEWTESGVPFFRSSDVVANYKGTENTKAFISMDLFKKLSEKSGRVSKDDILLTGGGSIGIPYLINSDEPLYFKDADLLWLKTASIIDGQFLYAFFITLVFRKYINSISHIGTISHYTIEQAKETPICLPQKEEQQKIGTFFKQLDDSIALQQRKLSHLQAQKKGLLQKMFPKAGQALPELRFPGFEGKWEERKLGEI
ncbi:MAG: restriction endonuclease subunit S, partial [Eubacteriaceae bacterium]